ncbi:MAG: hypothetical protein GY915_02530 [bacterium]|nr:hypothetical protein [bacterium]
MIGYITEDPDVFLSTSKVQDCVMMWSISISNEGKVLKRGGLHFYLENTPQSCQKFVSDMEVENGNTFYYLDTNYITDHLSVLYEWLSEQKSPKHIMINAKNIGGETLFWINDFLDSRLVKESSLDIESENITFSPKNLTFPSVEQGSSLKATLENIQFIPSCPIFTHSAQSYWEDLIVQFIDKETDTIFLHNYNSRGSIWTEDSSFEFQKFASILYRSYRNHPEDHIKTSIAYLYDDTEGSYLIIKDEPFVIEESPIRTYAKYIRATYPDIGELFSEEELSRSKFIKDMRISFEDKAHFLNFNIPKLIGLLNTVSKINDKNSLKKALEILREKLPQLERSQDRDERKKTYFQLRNLAKKT